MRDFARCAVKPKNYDGNGSSTDVGANARTVNSLSGTLLAQEAEPAEEESSREEAEARDSISREIHRESMRKRGISPVMEPVAEAEARKETIKLVGEMQKLDPSYRTPDTVGVGGEANSSFDQLETVQRDLSRARADGGGVYILRDPVYGDVMRSDRSNNLGRRQSEHGRDPALKDLEFETHYKTDVYQQQRGLEQLIHEQYQPPIKKINPISPTNPRQQEYIDAAVDYLKDQQ